MPFFNEKALNIYGFSNFPNKSQDWNVDGISRGTTSLLSCKDAINNSRRRRVIYAVLVTVFFDSCTSPRSLSNTTLSNTCILRFRKHEYEKHGTCAEDLQHFETQHDYFTNTMDYFDNYSVAKYVDGGLLSYFLLFWLHFNTRRSIEII